MKVSKVLLILLVLLMFAACQKQIAENSEALYEFPYETAKDFISRNGMQASNFSPPLSFLGWKEVDKGIVEVYYQSDDDREFNKALHNHVIIFVLLNTDSGPAWKFKSKYYDGVYDYGF